MSVSAPSACARAATNASLRTLFPPNPNAIASSRLTRRRGPPPMSAASRGIGSTGVGCGANGIDGTRASASRSAAGVTGRIVYFGRPPDARRQSADRSAIGIVRVRRRAAAAARGAGRRRGHGRVDRHVPRRAAAHAPGHVRVPHRQRRRRAGRGQPAPSRHQPRQRRAARAHRALPDVEAFDRVLPVVRRARASERVPGARRPRRRQNGGHAAIGRARVAAAADAA